MTRSHRIRARPARDALRRPATITDANGVASYLLDAARTPGGNTPLVAMPATEGEVAWVVREARQLLPIGAQSSLTGGATPFGEWVLSTARLTGIGAVRGDRVRAQAGVALVTLAESLRAEGRFFPPTPTYDGAFVGGVVATNAAGARTFKYGTTRAFVRGLTVVLSNGDVLDVEREQCRASEDGLFEIELVNGDVARVAIPMYAMPRVAKHSAGYHAEPRMDLVDLFVGSEGTLGVVTEAELRVLPEPARCLGWLPLRDETQLLALAAELRDDAGRAWRGESDGLDVASIESLDQRSLALLAEDGADREAGLTVDAHAAGALLFEIEVALDASSMLDRLQSRVERFADPASLFVALPGDTRRAQTLFTLREAVPLAVNRRVEDAQREVDPRIHKVAADMIVPLEFVGEAIAAYREAFGARGLDHAIWGHLSDGNLHANAIPRSFADVEQAQAAILDMGERVIRLGGSPMSEHGVGRNRVKQELLRRLYGDTGIAEMRRVKAALDPVGKLSPGVLFAR